jgi:hypothetical protein
VMREDQRGLSNARRSDTSRLPPLYLYRQLGHAMWRALRQRTTQGRNHSLRFEKNAIYFRGCLQGWVA